jgi:hypothetical protein
MSAGVICINDVLTDETVVTCAFADGGAFTVTGAESDMRDVNGGLVIVIKIAAILISTSYPSSF